MYGFYVSILYASSIVVYSSVTDRLGPSDSYTHRVIELQKSFMRPKVYALGAIFYQYDELDSFHISISHKVV